MVPEGTIKRSDGGFLSRTVGSAQKGRGAIGLPIGRIANGRSGHPESSAHSSHGCFFEQNCEFCSKKGVQAAIALPCGLRTAVPAVRNPELPMAAFSTQKGRKRVLCVTFRALLREVLGKPTYSLRRRIANGRSGHPESLPSAHMAAFWEVSVRNLPKWAFRRPAHWGGGQRTAVPAVRCPFALDGGFSDPKGSKKGAIACFLEQNCRFCSKKAACPCCGLRTRRPGGSGIRSVAHNGCFLSRSERSAQKGGWEVLEGPRVAGGCTLEGTPATLLARTPGSSTAVPAIEDPAWTGGMTLRRGYLRTFCGKVRKYGLRPASQQAGKLLA